MSLIAVILFSVAVAATPFPDANAVDTPDDADITSTETPGVFTDLNLLKMILSEMKEIDMDSQSPLEDIDSDEIGSIFIKTASHADKIDFIGAIDLNAMTGDIDTDLIYDSTSSVDVDTTTVSETSTTTTDANLTASSAINWNHLADVALALIREELIKRGQDRIPIPDIHVDFSKRVHFIKVSGYVKATNGWFSQLSTIRRTGDISVTQSGNSYVLKCALGFGVVRMGFDHWEIKITHFGPRPKGHLSASVGSNSIAVTVGVEVLPTSCRGTLKELRVAQLDDLQLRVSGLGLFDRLVSKKGTDALNRNKGRIVERIEEKLREALSKALVKLHCTEMFASVMMV